MPALMFVIELAFLAAFIVFLTQFAIIFTPYIIVWLKGYMRYWKYLQGSDGEWDKALQKKMRRDSHDTHAKQHNIRATSPDFIALIKAIAAEGRANRKEEQREDRGKERRELITIWLIALTFGAVVLQVREMIRVYDPIREQAKDAKRSADAAIKQSELSEKALIQAQRAWVGPRNASFTSEPSVGQPFDIVISYENSGREPALGFLDTVAPIPQTGDDDPDANERIQSTMKECQNWKNWKGGNVVYPNTSVSANGYSLTEHVDKGFVTDQMTTGKTTIVVHGCFVYRTFSQPKYVYFCYFYKHGATNIAALNICKAGQDAN